MGKFLKDYPMLKILGDYIRQYPNSIGMFKKIIVDKAINQVSVRYNIKVNRNRKETPIERQLYRGTS